VCVCHRFHPSLHFFSNKHPVEAPRRAVRAHLSQEAPDETNKQEKRAATIARKSASENFLLENVWKAGREREQN
jgi:hypothetical protein